MSLARKRLRLGHSSGKGATSIWALPAVVSATSYLLDLTSD